MSKDIKHIGVLTSGGDAPGMNAAIRAVVRTGLYRNLQVTGIIQGYNGLINGNFEVMTAKSVGNILQRGGTILKTGRSKEFLKPEFRKKAHENLKNQGIDALVCIGGDGTFKGAHALAEEFQFPIVGVPGTIDNDIYGTDYSIGFDTALNTALDAIDKIRDTAFSHDRLFVVEVMGRDSGSIALNVGLAGGAEEIFIPESPLNIDNVIDHINKSVQRGKLSSILVTAEGQKPGRAYDLAEAIRKKSGYESKVCILGHLQRGGSPTAQDRILASRLGASAVDGLLHGHTDVMIGIQNDQIVTLPLAEVITKQKSIRLELMQLTQILSI
ncbi:MAG: 6-phosphofructokinase [Bdellovibrionota bacterium]